MITPPTAHIHARLDQPTVIPFGDNMFAIDFGRFSIHATPEQWNTLDTAVRAGIVAAGQVVA